MIALLLGLWAGAADLEVPVPGSAWRLAVREGVDAQDRMLKVLVHEAACRQGEVTEADLPACVPAVDPVARTLRFGVQVRGTRDDEPIPAAISPSRLKVSVQTAGGADAVENEQLQVIGHDPLPGEQLVVLVVDRSGSMYTGRAGDEPMVRVVRALLQPVTRRKLLPEDGRSGVMLLAFSDQLRDVGGGPASEAAILTDDGGYEAAARALLHEGGGYTHLFDAVDAVMDEVLLLARVHAFVERTQSDPVVVLITDGFNNTSSRQACGANAAPLVQLMRRLRDVQERPGYAPVLHTVGFGRPYQPSYELVPVDQALTPEQLCGADVGRVIDGDLEDDGIDNPTLAYLARAGGGETVVTEDPLALARFLLRAGAPRHRWYEVRASLPEGLAALFRTRIPMRVDVRGVEASHAELVFIPHPLLDLPAVGSATALASAWVLDAVGLSLAALLALVGGRNLRRALLRRGVRA